MLTRSSLSALIDEYHRNGYAHVRNRVTLGTSAIGRTQWRILGRPIAAVSVAAIDSRMDRQRIAMLAKHLQGMARQIQHTLRNDVLDTG
jgi:DNA-binding IclR family transcriptional regulator